MIILLLVIGVILAASLALGRLTYEVESAHDTEYLELEGTWIRYNVIGGGPPVLLVHGWLTSSRVWDQLAPRLAQRFTVYTLDLTGFGESDKPLSGYGVRNGSRLLYAFCAHFGLTRTNVVAHDLGGNMAVKLAADHPDVVGRLVLVATPADENQIDLPTPLWLATLPVVGSIFYALGRLAPPVRTLWMRPFVLDPHDLSEEVVEDAGRSTAAAVGSTLSIARREISRGRLARQARIIKIPLLLIAGEEDQIVDPQGVGAWALSVDQAEVRLLDECGHLPMIERTVEFNAQILAFLTGDARYLDYAESVSGSDEEDLEYGEDAEVSSSEEGEEVAPPADPANPGHDATDLAPRHANADENEIQGNRATPNVVRRQGGRYPARNQKAEPEPPAQPSGDGAEDHRSRAGRTPSDEDVIPELPEDLFDWPDARNEVRSREWPRTGPSGERADGSDEPENPPRP
ncbi:MAG: alpha/beta fold hydrolase [Actinomycetota bacterium]|nr:alpha/beta fold hydrolase [Actinomycetota bacterium]